MNTPVLQRLPTIDMVRGVAVLGILLLNIVSFAMPDAAYFNPRAYGGWHGADLAAWLINFLFFDGRMRGLFSFLFGASLLIVADAAEAKGDDPARVHYARMGWLLVFGFAHLWLVWHGDILAHYALVGMAAFPLRKLPVPRLLGLGTVLVLVSTFLFGDLTVSAWHLTHSTQPGGSGALKALVETFGTPAADHITDKLTLHRSTYTALLSQRVAEHGTSPLSMLMVYGWETLGYMLFGMAALRSGLLTGAWPPERYRHWFLWCWAITLPIYAALAAFVLGAKFSLFAVMLGAVTLPGLVRPVMIVGWICLILLVMRTGSPLATRLAAVGRMAFTNYLATSILCTLLFYGYGAGIYGKLSRWQLYPVVLAVWTLLLLWSPLWLRHFRYGPFEWLWRSLSRAELQPIRNSLASRSQ
ncbi:DUF418 domain-containing protein [Sphingomonas sp. HT-1]|uniref:DUF418 domain-containing protein n=1 Tax=unclassified Sphingomonas TaxID=196159 RepID=UPI0002E61991|nr:MULTISPECIES: DUF418 domain-containing protein [unclassified Sphingomonas]KTF70540.1 hypothetical protein ATB93_03260 [Sphingomonas sp. WG]